MMPARALWLLLIFCLNSAGLQAEEAQQLRLTAPEFSPYSFSSEGVISGSAVLAVEEIFAELGVGLDLSISPNYGRALWKTKSGIVDGFFPASRNGNRDEVAEFSKPLMINRWSWFSLKDRGFNSEDKSSVRVGSLLSTNTHRWLGREGYQMIKPEVTVEALIQALKNNKLDGVLLAEVVFLHKVRQMGLDTESFNRQVEVEQPFGVYISHAYLQKHPHFMQRLNAAIERYEKDEQ